MDVPNGSGRVPVAESIRTYCSGTEDNPGCSFVEWLGYSHSPCVGRSMFVWVKMHMQV